MPFTPSHYAELRARLLGVPVLLTDAAADDSDKTFIVPAGKTWDIMGIWVEMSTVVTVGARQISVQIQDDAAAVVAEIAAGATQIASLARKYWFAPHLPDLTAFRAGDLLMTPLAPLTLPAGFVVRVYDAAVIAAAADDMTVRMLVGQRAPG